MRRLKFSIKRSLRLVIAGVVALIAVEQAAAEAQPYEAQVVAARAQVRSGPGENFYPTGTLPQGETVEVYREEAGGWLAIRPTEDSFSWVFGRHLKLSGGGLAKIEKDDVASRIGSGLSDKRNAVQVRLKKGEVVEIVGEESVGGETWYKIAPPAGEFRWIHAANVERSGTLPAQSAALAAAPPDVATSATNDSPATVADTAVGTTAEVAVSKDKPGDEWRAPPLARLDTTTAPVGATIAPPASSPPPASATISSNASARSPATSDAIAAQPPVGPIADELARQLTDIELRLSRMVAAPKDRWNTERLERDTEKLLSQAQNVDEREAVKATLAKIDRFAALGRQSQSLAVARSPDRATTLTAGLPGGAGAGDPRTTAPIMPLPGAMAGSPAEAARYDAVGILRPVVSKRPGAPQFALVDERGQVVSFVTPSPDINLQPYLGHRVGVVGSRGFIPEFNRAHVTAGRVTPLSERLVR